METFNKNRYNGQVGGCNVSVGRHKNWLIFAEIMDKS